MKVKPHPQSVKKLDGRLNVSTVWQTPRKAKRYCKLKLHRPPTLDEVSNPDLRVKSTQFEELNQGGASLAISNTILGVPADPVRGASRGGARNSAQRQSQALNTGHVGNLIAATGHALRINLPPNRMVTIHWEAAGVPPEQTAKATGRFLDLLTKALARHGERTAWVWVQENGEGKGSHCHALIHVPVHLAPIIAAKQRRWLRIISGKPYTARVILSRPIGGRVGLEISNPALYGENLGAALSYLLKGADVEAAQRFNLPRREDGGQVRGKRCGTSQNVGTKARSCSPVDH